jgi:hypothetical protein
MEQPIHSQEQIKPKHILDANKIIYTESERQQFESRNKEFCKAINSGEHFAIAMHGLQNHDLVMVNPTTYKAESELHYAVVATESGKIMPYPLIEEASDVVFDLDEIRKSQKMDFPKTLEALKEEHETSTGGSEDIKTFLDREAPQLIHLDELTQCFKNEWGDQFVGFTNSEFSGNDGRVDAIKRAIDVAQKAAKK